MAKATTPKFENPRSEETFYQQKFRFAIYLNYLQQTMARSKQSRGAGAAARSNATADSSSDARPTRARKKPTNPYQKALDDAAAGHQYDEEEAEQAHMMGFDVEEEEEHVRTARGRVTPQVQRAQSELVTDRRPPAPSLNLVQRSMSESRG